jgi:hypothetical protein
MQVQIGDGCDVEGHGVVHRAVPDVGIFSPFGAGVVLCWGGSSGDARCWDI